MQFSPGTMSGSSGIPWRKIGWIQFWLWIFPPWGLWLLYKEPTMDRTAKLRVAVYSILIPILLLTIVGLFAMHSTEKAIEGIG